MAVGFFNKLKTAVKKVIPKVVQAAPKVLKTAGSLISYVNPTVGAGISTLGNLAGVVADPLSRALNKGLNGTENFKSWNVDEPLNNVSKYGGQLITTIQNAKKKKQNPVGAPNPSTVKHYKQYGGGGGTLNNMTKYGAPAGKTLYEQFGDKLESWPSYH